MTNAFCRLCTRVSILLALVGIWGSAFSQTVPVQLNIEAEHFSAMQGATFGPTTYGEPQLGVLNCGAGDWIRFDSINFLSNAFDSVSVNYWTIWEKKDQNNQRHWFVAGSKIIVRLDSPTGTILATLPLVATDPNLYLYGPSTKAALPITGVSGVHSIVLTFEGSDTVCIVDKMKFSGKTTINASDAKIYHVAQTGNDADSGTSLVRAFRTIQQAALVMKPGSRCIIHQGIYRETVKPLYTGLAGAPLTFESALGENVFISGADPLANWVSAGASGKPAIYRTTMNWTQGRYNDQLLIDGKMVWTARCPNVDENYQPQLYTTWACGDGPSVVNMKPFQTLHEPVAIPSLVCVGTNGSIWPVDPPANAPWDYDISQNTLDGNAFDLPAAFFSRPTDFFKGGLISVHNNWWASITEITGSTSTATKTVVNGIKGSSQRVDKGGPGFISYVFGLLDAPNEWYKGHDTVYLWMPDGGSPDGHMVEAKRRICGMDLTSKQYVTVTGINFIATSMTMSDASYCVVDNCSFRYVSHYDMFDWPEVAVGFYNNPFDPSSGYSGIMMSGHHNTFKNSAIVGSAGSGIIVSGYDNAVTNCRIRDCNYATTYQAGIFVTKRDNSNQTDCLRLTLSKNTVSGCGRADIQIGQGSWMANDADQVKVQYNDLSHSSYASIETGAIGAQGSAYVDVSYNWIHSVSGNSMTAGGILMEYDFGAQHYRVHHNVFWNGKPLSTVFPVGSHWTFDWNDTGVGAAKLYNNTVVDSAGTAHRDWDLNWPGYKFNNIYGTAKYWKFTDTLNHDYTLTSASPAKDAGVMIPELSIAEVPDGKPDLGAYEYGKPRWVAGADWQDQPLNYPPSSTNIVSFPRYVNGASAASTISRFKNQFRIRSFAQQPWSATLFNAQGAIIKRYEALAGEEISVPTQKLGSGIVYVRIQQAGTYQTHSLLLQSVR